MHERQDGGSLPGPLLYHTHYDKHWIIWYSNTWKLTFAHTRSWHTSCTCTVSAPKYPESPTKHHPLNVWCIVKDHCWCHTSNLLNAGALCSANADTEQIEQAAIQLLISPSVLKTISVLLQLRNVHSVITPFPTGSLSLDSHNEQQLLDKYN